MMRTWLNARFAALAAAITIAAAPPISAHHSWTASYLEDQTVGADWANPNHLRHQGITRDTLKPGDRVILTGSPDRDPAAYRMHVKRIERPADGWKWIGG